MVLSRAKGTGGKFRQTTQVLRVEPRWRTHPGAQSRGPRHSATPWLACRTRVEAPDAHASLPNRPGVGGWKPRGKRDAWALSTRYGRVATSVTRSGGSGRCTATARCSSTNSGRWPSCSRRVSTRAAARAGTYSTGSCRRCDDVPSPSHRVPVPNRLERDPDLFRSIVNRCGGAAVTSCAS